MFLLTRMFSLPQFQDSDQGASAIPAWETGSKYQKPDRVRPMAPIRPTHPDQVNAGRQTGDIDAAECILKGCQRTDFTPGRIVQGIMGLCGIPALYVYLSAYCRIGNYPQRRGCRIRRGGGSPLTWKAGVQPLEA